MNPVILPQKLPGLIGEGWDPPLEDQKVKSVSRGFKRAVSCGMVSQR